MLHHSYKKIAFSPQVIFIKGEPPMYVMYVYLINNMYGVYIIPMFHCPTKACQPSTSSGQFDDRCLLGCSLI